MLLRSLAWPGPTLQTQKAQTGNTLIPRVKISRRIWGVKASETPEGRGGEALGPLGCHSSSQGGRKMGQKKKEDFTGGHEWKMQS